MPLSLEGEAPSRAIRDSRSKTVVALLSESDDGTLLRWSETAAESPNASALSHGRMTSGRDTIFLRSVIESDSWPIRLDTPDVMPTWNLVDPIPPRATRFSLQLQLPETIEEGWIEPIQSASVRRSRALAVLTPRQEESVALGLRFDIRCSRKLSCRIRYAGRLDPALPWQVLSIPLLEQFADQLTQQSILVSKESERLARVHEIAGPAGRRILRLKQDRNDQLAASIRMASQRVAQLQSLIAALESEGSVRIRLWVAWPDVEQDILTMENR